MIIQILLILFVVLAVLYVLVNRNKQSGRAWKKIALAMFACLTILTILFPEITSYVAKLLGVGRGADLLLYILVVAFIFYALNGYLRQQDQHDKMNRISRKVAIIEAVNRYINDPRLGVRKGDGDKKR